MAKINLNIFKALDAIHGLVAEIHGHTFKDSPAPNPNQLALPATVSTPAEATDFPQSIVEGIGMLLENPAHVFNAEKNGFKVAADIVDGTLRVSLSFEGVSLYTLIYTPHDIEVKGEQIYHALAPFFADIERKIDASFHAWVRDALHMVNA